MSDGLSDAIDRSRFQGQSPLYYMIAWVARQASSSEWALRMPSLVGAAGATSLIYLIARRHTTALGGLAAAAAFATASGIVFAATDARPYALASAAFALSLYGLLRWTDARRPAWFAVWTIAGALTLALSYTFGLGYLAHAAVIATHPDRRRLMRGVLMGVVVILLLIAPTVPHLIALATQDDILTFGSGGIPFRRFTSTLFPWTVIASVIGATIVAWPLRRVTERLRLDALATGAAWFVAPVLVLFFLAMAVTPKFFQDRYLLASVGGMALLYGLAIGALRSRRAAVIGLVVLLAASLVDLGGRHPRKQDWRAAADAVREHVTDRSTPVFVHTGFASDRPASGDPGSGLVLAPVSVYEIPGRIVHLPYRPTAQRARALSAVVEDRITDADEFIVVVSFDAWPYRAWFEQITVGTGFTASTEYASPYLDVYRFSR